MAIKWNQVNNISWDIYYFITLRCSCPPGTWREPIRDGRTKKASIWTSCSAGAIVVEIPCCCWCGGAVVSVPFPSVCPRLTLSTATHDFPKTQTRPEQTESGATSNRTRKKKYYFTTTILLVVVCRKPNSGGCLLVLILGGYWKENNEMPGADCCKKKKVVWVARSSSPLVVV